MRSCTDAATDEQREGGFTTIQYVAVTGFSLVLFVLMANLLVGVYQRGAVRDALDEGVRTAIPVGADPAECERRAREVVDAIGGSVVVDTLRCEPVADGIVAVATITVESWLLLPDWHVELRARATRET
jgi:hypothetical protein